MGSHALSPLLAATKARITALHQHNDTLYAGTADGSLRLYDLVNGSGEIESANGDTELSSHPKLLATYTLGRKPIDQIAVLPESALLVVLTDSVISLHKLSDPQFKPGITVLSQARTAHTFATTTYFTPRNGGQGSISPAESSGKVARDLLVVGCRKKVVVYGVAKTFTEAWELSLPHSPRSVIFPAPTYASLPDTVHLLYSPQASVLLHLSTAAPRLTVSDVPTAAYPVPRVGSSGGAGSIASPVNDVAGGGLASGVGNALTGLGGYMLGKGAAVPIGTRTVGGEVLIVRDDLGVFFSSEARFTRLESLQWPTAPDGIAFANPYIYSVVPGTPGGTTPATVVQPAIHIHLAPTLAHRETLSFPAPSAGSLTIRALSVASGKKSSARLLLVSTPTDRALAAAEGSTVWALGTAGIGQQVDELVREGRVSDAIGLVEAVGDVELLPNQRLSHLRTLQALVQFARGEYKPAFEAFIVHNVHPARVVALYSSRTISGHLAVPREGWMKLFGAVDGARLEPEQLSSSDSDEGLKSPVHGALRSLAQSALIKKNSVDTLRTSASGNDEPLSPSSDPSAQSVPASTPVDPDAKVLPREAVDELMYYLSDRRQKLAGAIAAFGAQLPAEADLPPLSSLPAAEVHALPSGPLTSLNPQQLLRTAQVVYTSLLKVYLIARPSLVGSLCRIENWCDVAEVEGLLREQKRFDDLRDLYMQKKMHDKALSMLLELAQSEDDPLDRYDPTIRYLQKLGPAHLDLIFTWSAWIIKEDPKRALKIFTADEPEVDALPRSKVVEFLEKTDRTIATGYLVHIIGLGESGADFHDKLAESYLRGVREAKATAEENVDVERAKALRRLLEFLNSSTQYRPYRLLSKLNADEVPEARAVLLGRMGNHDEALRIYVYRLEDYSAAEAYCARVYARDPDPNGIFLLLLRLYLRPTSPRNALVSPALSLIATHGTRVDARTVLDLLPPLVGVRDVHHFFLRTLRDGQARRNEHRVVRGLLAARKLEIERLVVGLEVKRVRVTDHRICPQCHKRLGQSAIAVHAPRGEVTHLHCKDQFSARLARLRS